MTVDADILRQLIYALHTRVALTSEDIDAAFPTQPAPVDMGEVYEAARRSKAYWDDDRDASISSDEIDMIDAAIAEYERQEGEVSNAGQADTVRTAHEGGHGATASREHNRPEADADAKPTAAMSDVDLLVAYCTGRSFSDSLRAIADEQRRRCEVRVSEADLAGKMPAHLTLQAKMACVDSIVDLLRSSGVIVDAAEAARGRPGA